MEPLLILIETLGVEIVRELRKRSRPKPRPRGRILRPGVETPHWLALVELARPHLRRRGAKALLARELGLNKGRVSQFFSRQTAMPDAERTLLLLVWLMKQTQQVAK